MSPVVARHNAGFIEGDAAGHGEKILHGDGGTENFGEGIQILLENIINIFVQGKLALFYKKSDSHSCDAFAHGMGDMPDSAAIRREVGFADDFPVSKNHEMMHVCIVGSHQITEQIRQHIGRNALAFRCCSGKWLLIGLVKWELGLLREKIYSACAIGFSKNDIGDQFCNCNLFFCHRLLLSGEGNIR